MISCARTTMKRMQQLISCYVVLCLALAGAVGISPLLHQRIEHGGHGPAHIHARGMAAVPVAVHSHDHGNGAGHVHPADHATEPSRPAGTFVHRHRPQTLAAFQLSRFWRALGQLFPSKAQSPSQSSPEDPGHTHDSLAQLLAGGLVEHACDAPPLECDPVSFPNRFLPAKVLLLNCAWDAQTASRGPPFFRS